MPNATADYTKTDYTKAARERVVIFDGALGTNVQTKGLDADDFGGPQFEGCNEILVRTRPDVVREIHASFLDVGVDVIETNTFGSFAVPLAEYGIADDAYDLSLTAAQLAKDVASSFTNKTRWVAGAMGPGTKMPTLGHIPFAALRDAYEVQACGLLDGGVDLLLVETQFDLLGAKAAIIGARRAMCATGREVPIQVQVTIETTGRMLPGTEIGAAYVSLRAMRPDVIGINCATGPAEMGEHLRYLTQFGDLPVSCMPNAGLPSVVDGTMHYDLTPKDLAEYHTRFITELGVNIVGGCCGTTPEHLRAVVQATQHLSPATRNPQISPSVASLYSAVELQQELSYLAIGERTNANGSKKFRDAMLAGDWDSCTAIARNQVQEGAHVLDVCVDFVGRSGIADMQEIAKRFTVEAAAPLVLDSTEPDVLEAGLQWIGGKPILNSANLEDGDAPGSRAERVFSLAREYGTAVICLLIDEEGQARDLAWKLRVAHRLHNMAIQRFGLNPEDLIFDALTFPLSTGDDALRDDAHATIEAIRHIKQELPGVRCVLGVSNVSFGLSPAIRQALNSVFLFEAQQAGLDAAIVNTARILPMHTIDERARKLCLDLIYNRRTDTYDPLAELLSHFSGTLLANVREEDRSDWPVSQRLQHRIIDGNTEGLREDLDEAMVEGSTPLDIINNDLLAGMKVVGDLFGSGEMQLPFVLKSAETMKRAVAYLEEHMPALSSTTKKGRIVLATVKGDVHDIGKNLVDIILTNNGYEVHNLGIKIAIAEIIERAQEVNADMIGMSGLLVKSTLIMQENLEELNARGLSHIPVILGGAALNRTYVERDLRSIYNGRVFYGRDAFEGLDTLNALTSGGLEDPEWGRKLGGRKLPPRAIRTSTSIDAWPTERSSFVASDNTIFEPPFLGSRIERGIRLDEIVEYLNETTLFRHQWQFRPQNGESDVEFKSRIRPRLHAMLADAKRTGVLIPQVAYGYWPANSEGNTLVIYRDIARTEEIERFAFPRQGQESHLCIADFFRPTTSGEVDYVAFHIVTMGNEVSKMTSALFAEDAYQDYLMLHGLGVEMAEALAEYWHARIRREWGFADEDGPTLSGLFRQQYRGGRYSWGYPACPDLEDNSKVARLVGANRIGVEVSEASSWQFHPEQTTSAIICHHPQAKYFVAK